MFALNDLRDTFSVTMRVKMMVEAVKDDAKAVCMQTGFADG